MKKLTWISLAVVAAVAGGGGGVWWWSQRDANAGVQYRTGKLERGALSAAVSATGTVNPVSLVTVGTQVSGQIQDIFVDFNSEVKAGQLLARIDPETFEYRLRSAQADVDAARATVLTAQASIASSRAGVSRVQVDLDEAQRDHERKLSLVDKQFIAQSEADKARALVNTTAEQLKAAQAQLGVTQAQAQSATASVAQREAALAQARVDVSRTRITSPVNGIVIKRAIEKGQTVASSLQSPELFVIAQNLQDMQVDASIDEADVGRIRNGLKASFTVDAFPGQTFEGDVKQVRKAAQTVANVVTYVAVVGFNNTSGRLLPGMTANVRLVTDQRDSVLKVPNAALRVRIAGVEPAPGAGAAPSAAPASGSAATTGAATGFTWLSQAQAQPSGPPPGSPGAAPGGSLAALRDRLTAELQLTADQQGKLDAIGVALRPRFMALRDLPDEQRPTAREAVSAEMRKQIAAMLTPVQQARYAQLQEQQGAGRASGGAGDGSARPQRSDDAKAAKAGVSASAGAAAATSRQANATHSIANSKDGKSAGAENGSKFTAPSAPSAAVAGSAPGGGGGGGGGSGGEPAAAPGGSGGPGGGGAGGPLAEFRRRLVADVRITPDQLDKVDALYADARPRFMALRELPEAERGKARERLSGDIRARINELLTPEQKPRYAALQAEIGARQTTRGRIYLLGEDGKPRAYNVRLGISDGSSTELLVSPNSPEAASLKEGALVVTGVSGGSGGGGAKPAGSTPAAGPRPMF